MRILIDPPFTFNTEPVDPPYGISIDPPFGNN